MVIGKQVSRISSSGSRSATRLFSSSLGLRSWLSSISAEAPTSARSAPSISADEAYRSSGDIRSALCTTAAMSFDTQGARSWTGSGGCVQISTMRLPISSVEACGARPHSIW